MEPFGPETSWLAIHSNDRAAVRAALGLAALEQVPVAQGLARARRRGVSALRGGASEVFVTAPIDDSWTLVVLDVPDAAALGALAERASRALGGEVQAFVCRAGARRFAWLRYRKGALERAFEQLRGKPVRDSGDRLRGEPAEIADVNESTVLEVAGSWSVDPSTFSLKTELPADGFIGSFEGAAGARSRWGDAVGWMLGSLAVVLIEIAAILALGRVFGRTSWWGVGALLGLALLFGSRLAPERSRWRTLATLLGVALALGAVLGGAFPHRAE